MADDTKQPATKGDLQKLRRDVTALQVAQKGEIRDIERRLKIEFDMKLRRLKEEITLHFDVVAENMTSHFQGAFSDKLESHEQRMTRLACPPKPCPTGRRAWRREEQHTGVAA